jgi:16S rRNA (adenine1518-N6/adenine1519-N6)-dimethyltransferase
VRPSRGPERSRHPGAASPAAWNRPRKRFAQHFLTPAWVERVVNAIGPRPGDRILEIGPGRGALTRALAPHVARLVAVEIDRDLAGALMALVPDHVRIVTADVLDVDPSSLIDGRGWRVVGNLPYNLTSPILFRLLQWQRDHSLFDDATVMVQREVAERLTAEAGGRDYGVLTITVRLDAEVSPVLALPPAAFRPPPRVDSSLVRLTFRPSPVDVGDRETFVALVRQLFMQRRKTLRNALRPFAEARGWSAAEAIARAGLDAAVRPETLQLSDFASLALLFDAVPSGPVL